MLRPERALHQAHHVGRGLAAAHIHIHLDVARAPAPAARVRVLCRDLSAPCTRPTSLAAVLLLPTSTSASM